MRKATAVDTPLLINLMAEFYAESGYHLDRTAAAASFHAVLADDRLGSIWIIQSSEEDVGHLILTFKYAMEYGGVVACLDDLYVKPLWRNQGLARRAIMEAREFCQRSHIHAITVEVAFDNSPAQAAYRKAGFAECQNRQLLALPLAPPIHLV